MMLEEEEALTDREMKQLGVHHYVAENKFSGVCFPIDGDRIRLIRGRIKW